MQQPFKTLGTQVTKGNCIGQLAIEEPPGAVLRCDGRLTAPSTCPHIVRLWWLS